ncbi:unnamed protein product [Cuscuta campestris]|uniref:DUF4219 domain-containing protein n=1 Tax=Cuscuta campestris TaxID=132261 RepID=A0A484N508_9ASTE|nr:unnamed protein product [Cuscuta campestris]
MTDDQTGGRLPSISKRRGLAPAAKQRADNEFGLRRGSQAPACLPAYRYSRMFAPPESSSFHGGGLTGGRVSARLCGLGEGQSTTRPPLFYGTNYTYWKERMRIFIQSNNFLLWRIIKNGEEVPMKKVGETTVPKTEDEYDAQDIKKIENNANAINILYCAVNPDDYRKISCCSTAKDMWDKLEITYEGEQKKNGIALKASTSQERAMEDSSDEDEFGIVLKKFHKFMSQEGQRKRSRTGKNVASSSAPPPPPVHKYLDGSFLWFNDRAEATQFSEKFEHREILPPRFSTACFIHDSIPREARVILERGNFLDLLYIKKAHYHSFLVRAFYSNLKKDEDGALISKVNGVDIYLNEENIQILTGLRRDGQDLGLYVGEEGARFNETALLEEVGIQNIVPTHQQQRPTIASMSPVFRFIFYVLTRILKPRKFNHTTLSQEDTKTIHAMIHNANLNWGKFVMTHMFNATSDNRPLPYALLVMVILDEFHIKTDVGPKCKGTKHWEIDESSAGSSSPPTESHCLDRRRFDQPFSCRANGSLDRHSLSD